VSAPIVVILTIGAAGLAGVAAAGRLRRFVRGCSSTRDDMIWKDSPEWLPSALPADPDYAAATPEGDGDDGNEPKAQCGQRPEPGQAEKARCHMDR